MATFPKDAAHAASHPPARLVLLAGLAAILGLAGGGAAFVLVRLIGLLTNLALFHRLGWSLPSMTTLQPGPWLVVAALTGGLVVSLLARWSPTIRGHGIPEAMEAVLVRESRIPPRVAVAKPISAAVAIGTGGPFGAEGPIIVTGGALGSLLGQVLRVSPAERKILLASGAAAGMAAIFGTPLAAILLAVELLLFEFSTRAFVALAIAASLAAGMHAFIFGAGPLFTVAHHQFAGLGGVPLFGALGIGCGLLAVVLTKGLAVVEAGYRRLPVGAFWHPILGAAGFALVGLVVPRALGVGYDSISAVLAGRLAIGTLAALGLAKLIAWWVALGSGTSGGTLAPILLISACAGSLFGTGAAHLFPGLHASPVECAVVAMAATFGAATWAPLASIVFVFELTQDYRIVLPLIGATVVAYLLSTTLLSDSLMTDKLTRRGLRVSTDYQVDTLRTTSVADIMTTTVATLDADTSLADAHQRFLAGGHSAYPIIQAGHCIGILTRTDLLNTAEHTEARLVDIANQPLITVAPDDSALTALTRILQDDIEHLPVLDHDHLVGILTRTDLLKTRTHHLHAETPQPPWRPQPSRRRHPVNTQPAAD